MRLRADLVRTSWKRMSIASGASNRRTTASPTPGSLSSSCCRAACVSHRIRTHVRTRGGRKLFDEADRSPAGGEVQQAGAFLLQGGPLAPGELVAELERGRRGAAVPGQLPGAEQEAVDEQRGPVAELAVEPLADPLRDDARPVGVREQHVVELGQEARRRGSVGRRTGGVGEVEELRAVLVFERDQAPPETVEDLGEAGEPAPDLGVLDGGGAERGEVADDQALERDRGAGRFAEPRLDRRVEGAAALAPDASRRWLDESDAGADGDRERERIAAVVGLRELLAELAERARALFDEPASVGGKALEVQTLERATERAPRGALLDDLERRPQCEGVLGADEVDRGALEGDADDAPVLDGGREAPRVERVDPAPEAGVGVERLLRLEPDEVLDHVDRIARLALQQELAGEKGTVEFLGTEHSVPQRGGWAAGAHQENGAIVALPVAYLRCPFCDGSCRQWMALSDAPWVTPSTSRGRAMWISRAGIGWSATAHPWLRLARRSWAPGISM